MTQMKLWHLDRDSSGYDIMLEAVVRASSEQAARKYAASVCGGEGPKVWLDPKKSECKLLSYRGKAGVIIQDFNAG